MTAKTRLKITGGLLALTVLFVTCRRIPPYSGELSLHVLFNDSFTLREKIGPVYYDDHFEEDNTVVHYLPDQGNPRSGFVLLYQNDYGSARVLYNSGSGSLIYGDYISYNMNNSIPDPLVYKTFPEGPAGERYVALIEYGDSYSILNLVIFRYLEGEVQRIVDQQLRPEVWAEFYDGSEGATYLNWDIENDHTIIGACFNPADDRLYICSRYGNSAPYEYYETSYSVNPETGLVDQEEDLPQQVRGMEYLSIDIDIGTASYQYLPGKGGLVFVDMEKILFQPWDYTTGVCDPGTVVELPHFYTHRLQSGHFLSSVRKSLRLYNDLGAELSSLEDCNLVFEEEFSEAGESLLLFSSTYYINSHNEDDGFYFYLYSGTVTDLAEAAL